jgi:Protein of unknown function (DUF1554)
MPVQFALPARHGGKVELVKRFFLIAVLVASACSEDSSPSAPTAQPMSFFVTSQTSTTGNIGGLAGADAMCQRLADGVGSKRFWRAYLSVERDASNNNKPANARDRIGIGPWYNATGALVANNVGELHARTGDASLFVDERGQRINGQWVGSPSPVQHDIMTGSNADGTLMSGFTCADWTSSSAADVGQVGHSDGMGPGQSTAGALASWNSAHANQNCADTAPRGGAGRIYCFAR